MTNMGSVNKSMNRSASLFFLQIPNACFQVIFTLSKFTSTIIVIYLKQSYVLKISYLQQTFKKSSWVFVQSRLAFLPTLSVSDMYQDLTQ
jgi:hypothetical protein